MTGPAMTGAALGGVGGDAASFAFRGAGAYAVRAAPGVRRLDCTVEGARCGGCLAKIERALLATPGVISARLNLSTGRLRMEWSGDLDPARLMGTVADLGYRISPYQADTAADAHRNEERRLLTAMAVAAFAAANVMLLSVSVWSGAEMTPETVGLLHWISALIAIPAAAFAGRPFFESAVRSLKARRLNMDVPISLAVILAIGMSLIETVRGGEHAYFDAAVTLLFFLLIGRFLDARLRRRAFAAANALSALQSASCARIDNSGRAAIVRATDIVPGDEILVAAGERIPVDVIVVDGHGEADLSMITGESVPARLYPGQVLHAGAIPLGGAVRARALHAADDSLMSEIARLLEAGEQKKSSYRKIADKAAEAYVPRVHALAALGLVGWLIAGATLQQSVFIAITVLIITCPCAMALAAPVVQVAAAGRLFRQSCYLSSGDALERIAACDHVVFDKTGTLTVGEPVPRPDAASAAVLPLAAQLARASRHPFSRALAMAAGSGPVAEGIEELPGQGVSGRIGERIARLGSAVFVGAEAASDTAKIWFRLGDEPAIPFSFDDRLRPDIAETAATLRRLGVTMEVLSGDDEQRVLPVARALGAVRWTAGADPVMKARRLDALEAEGRRVLMVGDGLNDAGALAKAHASIAPGGAVDISRRVSDCVFSGDRLEAVAGILITARAARARMKENFLFSGIYNIVAVPIALAGLATPMVAAIAMSLSSVIVTLNALRMNATSLWRS